MKLKQFITASMAGLVCFGSMVANSATADENDPQPKPELRLKSDASAAKLNDKKYTFIDVKLSNQDNLPGVVFNKERQPVADALVLVRQAGKEVARTRSNEQGEFEIKSLKPGNYHIIAGTGHGLFRVWTTEAAPPKAFAMVKIMSDKSVTRAQNDILVDPNTGESYGQVRIYDGGGLTPVPGGQPVGFFNGGGGLGALGVWDVLTGAAAFTALGFAIDNYNSIQDLKDRPARRTPN